MKTKMDGLEVAEQWPNYHNYTFHISQSTKGLMRKCCNLFEAAQLSLTMCSKKD